MRVFTILGPSHSGKSTLAQAMAGLDEGKVTSSSISDAVTLHMFTYLGDDWTAIDIAGGPDNFAYAGPALAMSDAAVLCAPPEPDAAVLSAPYLRLVEEAEIPCFLFINRMDSATDRVRDIVAALQSYCGHSIVLRQIPIREGGEITGAVDLISERAWEYHDGQPSSLIELPDASAPREQEARTELLENLADFDDALLEQLIEDQRPMTGDVFDLATRVIQHGDLISAFLGAASHTNGVTRLMKSLRHEAPEYTAARDRVTDDTSVLAVGGLADIRKHIGKLVVVRAFAGGVAAGAQLGGGNVGGITGIDARTAISELSPGAVGILVKSDHLEAGKLYTADATLDLPAWAQARPAMHREIVTPVQDRDDVRLSGALGKLVEIDPGLEVAQDELTGKAIVGAQGPVHARRIIDKLSDDFGIAVEHRPVPPSFCETIARPVDHHHRHRKQSGGAGQFADVHIEIRPAARGGGFQFDETVKGGAVPRNYIPSVQAGAKEALAQGPNGFPVVDVQVTLKDGKHHSVDSSDFAFRTAGKNAVREALQEAKPFVLQPILQIDISVPSVFAGGLVPAVSGLKGQVLGFEGHPSAKGWDVFSALLPAAQQDDLFRALGSATRGTAWFTSRFDHFEDAGSNAGLASDIAKGLENA